MASIVEEDDASPLTVGRLNAFLLEALEVVQNRGHEARRRMSAWYENVQRRIAGVEFDETLYSQVQQRILLSNIKHNLRTAHELLTQNGSDGNEITNAIILAKRNVSEFYPHFRSFRPLRFIRVFGYKLTPEYIWGLEYMAALVAERDLFDLTVNFLETISNSDDRQKLDKLHELRESYYGANNARNKAVSLETVGYLETNVRDNIEQGLVPEITAGRARVTGQEWIDLKLAILKQYIPLARESGIELHHIEWIQGLLVSLGGFWCWSVNPDGTLASRPGQNPGHQITLLPRLAEPH